MVTKKANASPTDSQRGNGGVQQQARMAKAISDALSDDDHSADDDDDETRAFDAPQLEVLKDRSKSASRGIEYLISWDAEDEDGNNEVSWQPRSKVTNELLKEHRIWQSDIGAWNIKGDIAKKAEAQFELSSYAGGRARDEMAEEECIEVKHIRRSAVQAASKARHPPCKERTRLTAPQFRLLDLPAELRQAIFSIALPTDKTVKLHAPDGALQAALSYLISAPKLFDAAHSFVLLHNSFELLIVRSAVDEQSCHLRRAS